LRHTTPAFTGRPLDLLLLDGADVAPSSITDALGLEDHVHGRAGWIGAIRHYARRYMTTVIIGTGDDVLAGRPDPDIGDQDVLIDVGWFDPPDMSFPVTVTHGRFNRTRLFASWMPHRSGLAWRLAPDRS